MVRLGDFNGVIDGLRMVNYQRMAFGGGIMIANVNHVDDTFRIYNANPTSTETDGLELWSNSTRCKAFLNSQSISVGLGAVQSSSCDWDIVGGVYLVDDDTDNDESSDASDENGKEWIIDGVCWNNAASTGSTTDGECDAAAPMIEAGVWAEDAYIDIGSNYELLLNANGNNDDGVSDWGAIPELSTLLMPIASVILIVGYNYRRKTELTKN
jgi:hypothetical protein